MFLRSVLNVDTEVRSQVIFSHAFHDHTYVIKTMVMHKCLQFSATEAPFILDLEFEVSNLQPSGV